MMMRVRAALLGAASCLTRGAQAADLPRRAPPDRSLPVFTGMGLYAGPSAGYGSDCVLVSGTGGFTYGGGSRSASAAAYPSAVPKPDRTGYAAGGGIEYAFTERFSAEMEALCLHRDRGFSGAAYYNAAALAYFGAGKQNSDLGLVRSGVTDRF